MCTQALSVCLLCLVNVPMPQAVMPCEDLNNGISSMLAMLPLIYLFLLFVLIVSEELNTLFVALVLCLAHL